MSSAPTLLPTLPLSLLPLPALLALLGVALLARRQSGCRPRAVLWASRAATLFALGTAVVTAVATAAGLIAGDAMTSATLGAKGFGLSLRVDALSATAFLLVAGIGAVVVQFSRNYLDGDARQGAFLGGLCLTLAAVMLLVLAGNLVLLVLAWIGTSLALHRLLLFRPERPGAVLAARKKFLTARLGDLALIGAAVILAVTYGTGDIATILKEAGLRGAQSAPVTAAALLIALAAVLKSAQVPTHGWLLDVMETPTPVSALLHAGIVNAGGFLVIRFADVMLLAPAALHLLVIAGATTALIGGLALQTQSSVKAGLAWSTVAQMGFMLLQCGLGLFAMASLHLVAHSLYKAHAFLAAGGIVEKARAGALPTHQAAPPPGRLGLVLATALAAYLAVALPATSGEGGIPTAGVVLGALLVLALARFLADALGGDMSAGLLARAVARTGVLATAYAGLHAGAVWVMADTLPTPATPGPVGLTLLGLVGAGFLAALLVPVIAPTLGDGGTPPAWWRAARVHIANGLYANALFNRLVGALRTPIKSSF